MSACFNKSIGNAKGLALPSRSSLTPKPGQNVVTKTLTARPTTLDLGGPQVVTWAYDGVLPGPVVRATAGDLVRITLKNQLPAESSIHWHGVALRNAADGVPGLTQDAVAAGETFVYEFVAPDPGTYFYHPHVGVQLDRGLYAPLIIDDPDESGDYDLEWIVVLDDWIDGTGSTPDQVLAALVDSGRGSGEMGGMDMGSSDSLFGDAGDVTYPYFLVNGRIGDAPDVLRARPGQRVRIRIINASADTIFSVALGDHRLTMTHSDGFAVQPEDASAFYIGMGERYDVVTTLKNGVFPLVAKPVGREGVALGAIRTGTGYLPTPEQAEKLPELTGQVLMGVDLMPTDRSRLPSRDVGQTVALTMTGQMSPYVWAINGAPYPESEPLEISSGTRVSLELENKTMMAHPFHLHGHTFALPGGLRKDTLLLKPMQKVAVQIDADNPGNWMAHCHNIYHAEAGMMIALTY